MSRTLEVLMIEFGRPGEPVSQVLEKLLKLEYDGNLGLSNSVKTEIYILQNKIGEKI